LTSIPHLPAHRFDFAALCLVLQAFALRAPGRAGRPAQQRYLGDHHHHFLQTQQGIGLVLFLTAVRLGLDNDHPLLADAMIAQRQQTQLDIVRQGRSADIETQMNRARYLVDVLSPRALRTDRSQFDLFVGNQE
jgi:hypothetical protein